MVPAPPGSKTYLSGGRFHDEVHSRMEAGAVRRHPRRAPRLPVLLRTRRDGLRGRPLRRRAGRSGKDLRPPRRGRSLQRPRPHRDRRQPHRPPAWPCAGRQREHRHDRCRRPQRQGPAPGPERGLRPVHHRPRRPRGPQGGGEHHRLPAARRVRRLHPAGRKAHRSGCLHLLQRAQGQRRLLFCRFRGPHRRHPERLLHGRKGLPHRHRPDRPVGRERLLRQTLRPDGPDGLQRGQHHHHRLRQPRQAGRRAGGRRLL